MKYKIILLLIFSFFICIKSAFSIDTTSGRFMPLAIGNKWIYNYVESYPGHNNYYIKKIKIIGDTLIMSKQFFKITGYPFSNNDSTYTFIRYDSTNGKLIKYFVGSCNNSYTFAKLSALIGDTTGNCQVYDDFICTNIQDTILFNLNTILKTFHYEFINHYFNIKNLIFGKNIGMETFEVSSGSGSSYFDNSYKLKGFVLNGIVYGDTTTILGIKSISNEIPSQFLLYQNYPNPFNPTTKIKFALPSGVNGQSSIVNLKIFDILGKEVAILVNEQLQAGTYEADWDASNEPSGVYYYKLTAGDYNETRKMVLVK